MLITNFAAGELAETLFGRVDMGQYYSGVSHLENFDVIPTGGISRRHGMKRIRRMEGEGRIIPFILNRELSFLLFLLPGKIQILRDGKLLNTVLSSSEVPLYQTIDEINEVQYAQNYDKMVLVHENYAPILLELFGGNLQLKIFPVFNDVENKRSENVSAIIEYDNTYLQFLKEYGNYPRAVTFFGGRIIFAGTKNNPQRVFASQVNNIYNFSTYKLFLTEQREYIVILGSVDTDDRTKIILDKDVDAIKFTRRPDNYYVDSPFFPEGTKIVEMDGGILTLSEEADIQPFDHDAIEAELRGKRDNYNAWSGSDEEIVFAYSKYKAWNPKIDAYEFIESTFYLYPRVERSNFLRHTKHWISLNIISEGDFPLSPIVFPYNACAYYNNDNNYFRDIINNYIAVFSASESWKVPSGFEVDNHDIYDNVIFAFINTITSRITSTMWYALTTKNGIERYYNFPSVLYATILDRIGGSNNIYISLYTKEVIEDRYPTPDDGFTFEIASDMSDEIRWIAQNKNLLVGTETGEWVIPAGVNATNVQAVLNSRYGSDRIQATTVGDAMCFFQSGRKALVEYYIPQQDNNFRANNMAMLNKNMLHESPAFDFDFISAPYTKFFVSREDGVVVTLLYERNTGTFAWGRITTGGKIKSVATAPGLSGYDDVFLIVRRGDDFFLERHSERIRSVQDHEEAVFLDSYQRWDGNRHRYSDAAILYDETDNKVYPLTQDPIPDHVMWIGYPYESRVRSMPVLANDRMKQNNIKNLYVRFNDSFMPKVRSVSMEEGKERMGNMDSIGRPEPYSGVVQIAFPGVWDRDVFFELIHDKPTRCRVLAVNAEAN